ncbi:hypothetical protein [Nostocoides australiense]|nr:hypothetical protein [Tetrasphaera sp.]HPF81154.1 hypothetical protein [Tetrasphaera australiensis]HRW01507.1 hypothetical protein [Tetrasphaera sp.]
MSWLDILGWAGSALLVVSVMQTRILRLRLLNLAATIALLVFNWGLGIWSMVAMNGVLAALNVYYIAKLQRENTSASTAYEVIPVDHDEASLTHFLARNGRDIARFNPGFAGPQSGAAYLIQKGDTTCGVVLVRDIGDGVAQVDLDYVTAPYRDFSPGKFVFRDSGLFQRKGFRRVLTRPGMVAPHYGKLGFVPDGDRWALELDTSTT